MENFIYHILHTMYVKRMTKFEIEGKEMLIKIVKAHGGGAMVYIPKSWAGSTVAVIRDVKE